MNILTLDTSGPHLSLALRYNDQIFEYFLTSNLKHNEFLLSGIDILFKVSEMPRDAIDLIGCSFGPGSFTGLRVGVVTAKGLSIAWNIPLVFLSSLLVHGQSSIYTHVLSVLDARRSHFYVARYQDNQPISCEYDMSVSKIEEKFLLENIEPLAITGPGAELLYQQLTDKKNVLLDPFFIRPRAKNMINLTQNKFEKEGACADEEGPNYLRISDAQRNLVVQMLDVNPE